MKPTILLAALAALAGCQGAQQPPSGPCGANPVHCVAQPTCCGQGEVCGGDPDVVGCFANSCCPVIGGGPTAAPDARRAHPQVKLQSEERP